MALAQSRARTPTSTSVQPNAAADGALAKATPAVQPMIPDAVRRMNRRDFIAGPA
jgi:hypothetical protein